MSSRFRPLLSAVVMVTIGGCAKVQVSDRQTLYQGQLPRPSNVYVYDFVAHPSDAPSGSTEEGHSLAGSSAQTPEQIRLWREIGAEVAKDLVTQIDAMGLHAAQVSSDPALEQDDLVIRGTLLKVVEGSAAERVAIGMGKGAAELRVAVQGYQMTPTGLRQLGSGVADTAAGKTPGAAVPAVVAVATHNPLGLIVSTGVKLHDEQTGKSTIHGKTEAVAKEIAAQLRPRFEAQGWIPPSQPAR
jgi:hypothetical protein